MFQRSSTVVIGLGMIVFGALAIKTGSGLGEELVKELNESKRRKELQQSQQQQEQQPQQYQQQLEQEQPTNSS